MAARTVFWSWQSDFGERENRNLIREALLSAIEVVAASLSLEERIEVDHDTKGLPGSPDIVASILAKIDAATVFVGDVTPIAVSHSAKQIANPNVLIELGYAKKSLGPEQIITVWNKAPFDSRPEHLPFDLRGRRGPISYDLPIGASKAEYRAARENLTKNLVARLGPCLTTIPEQKEAAPDPIWQPSIEGDPSIWLEPKKTFRVNESWGSGTKYFAVGARWYVRVLPSAFDPEILQTGIHGPLMDGYGGFSWGHMRGGLLTYSGSVRADVSPELDAASMWFDQTGEIWMFRNGVSGSYNGRQQFFGDHIPQKWLEFTGRALATLRDNGGPGPYHVRVGVTGLEGTSWPMINSLIGDPPVALEDRVEEAFVAASANVEDWFDSVVAAWNRLRRVYSVGKADSDMVQRWRISLTGE